MMRVIAVLMLLGSPAVAETWPPAAPPMTWLAEPRPPQWLAPHLKPEFITPAFSTRRPFSVLVPGRKGPCPAKPGC